MSTFLTRNSCLSKVLLFFSISRPPWERSKHNKYSNQLYEALLSLIASFLSPKTKTVSFGLVCRKWFRASALASSWPLVQIFEINLQVSVIFSRSVLKNLKTENMMKMQIKEKKTHQKTYCYFWKDSATMELWVEKEMWWKVHAETTPQNVEIWTWLEDNCFHDSNGTLRLSLLSLLEKKISLWQKFPLWGPTFRVPFSSTKTTSRAIGSFQVSLNEQSVDAKFKSFKALFPRIRFPNLFFRLQNNIWEVVYIDHWNCLKNFLPFCTPLPSSDL